MASVPYRALDVVDPQPASSGAELIDTQGRSLPLTGARLVGTARGGLARCVLEQRFENRHAENLRVRYRMPLPADGAVSAYAFEVAGRVIEGRVQRKAEARERFERAVAAGHTAGLLEQDRADVFTQELGNIPPGEAIVARITIDQRLAWVDGGWELRFPTVIGPRYCGARETAEDAWDTAVKVAPGQIGARVEIELELDDELTGAPDSPSHALRVTGSRVALRARRGEPLDRDIVVRWPVAGPEVGLSLKIARGGGEAYGLLTIVPPAVRAEAVPRDLIVLVDTSGSMAGPPLDQAKQVIALLIESLGPADRLELIEFSDRPRRYQRDPIAATPAARREAIAWLRRLSAGGGTEMADGVREALLALRPEAQRQVVLVTDGYIGGERQILELLLHHLPASCRLHVIGVGSAPNRSLSTALARAGRGAEILAGLHEDAERAAARLIARTAAPVLVDVEIAGSAVVAQAPEHVPDVFAGAPVVAALQLAPSGGDVIVRARSAGGAWEKRIRMLSHALPADDGRSALPALYARERVADLEARGQAGERIDEEIEQLGVRFQIATRLTSWVAVDLSRAVTGPSRREDMPQELPYGTSAASFGLRSADEGGAGDVLDGLRARSPISRPMGPMKTVMIDPPPWPQDGENRRGVMFSIVAPETASQKRWRRWSPIWFMIALLMALAALLTWWIVR